MKYLFCGALLLALLLSANAQVTARRLVRPLTKDGVIPPASAPAQPRPVAPAPAAAQPAVPAIEPDLQPSKISLLGKIDGLAGTLYVTNIGPKSVAPYYQIAVLDQAGRTIGWVTNTAPEVQPKESEKIQVLATNVGAADLKLMRLFHRK